MTEHSSMTDTKGAPRVRALIVTGPTATGKTRLAVELARQFNGEIISADCRQVYRRLDLGTGKDLEEYGLPPDQVPFHLIDIVEPDGDFHLLKFLQLATEALDGITARGRLPIIAGGTPLYINALLNGYDMPGGSPDPAFREEMERKSTDDLIALLKSNASKHIFERTDLTQRRRIIRALEIARNPKAAITLTPLQNPLVIAPFYERATVRRRIEIRLEQRLKQGMLDEVASLHDSGITWERLDWFGLEYRFLARHLKGELTLEQAKNDLLAKIRNFAKSQDIWFRKLEREGHPIHWLPDGDSMQAAQLVRAWLNDEQLPPPAIVLNDIRYGRQV